MLFSRSARFWPLCAAALSLALSSWAQSGVRVVSTIQTPSAAGDWLVTPVSQPVELQVTDSSATPAHLALANGVIAREFYFGAGNLATVSLRHLGDGSEFVRALRPEALLSVNGTQYSVGGLTGQTLNNFLTPEWFSSLTAPANAFTFRGFATSAPQAFRSWTNRFGAPPVAWPPTGLRVDMFYDPPASLPGVQVTVHYEMYQGTPIIAKWLTVSNTASSSNLVDGMTIEQLAVSPPLRTRLFTEAEFNCFRLITTFWELDPNFSTETGPVFEERMEGEALNYWPLSDLMADYHSHDSDPLWQGEYRSRSQLSVRYPSGPWKRLAPGQSYDSFIVWEVPQDSDDAERKGLARRRLYRTVMPWTQESPIDVHISASDSASIRSTVDQAAALGFEKVTLAYGGGLDMNNTNASYTAQLKSDFDYAHSKGLIIGGYILFCSSRSYGSAYDAVPSAYGNSLCLGSSYSDTYFQRLFYFFDQTGMDVIEPDGPYHGYPCTSTSHQYHEGSNDAVRVNWERQVQFFKGCVDRHMYIQTPDWYFHGGNSVMPMGYRESNANLPARLQTVMGRQTINDGTLWRTPGMCWNDGVAFNPPSANADLYQTILATYFGAGIPGQFWMPLSDDATFPMVKGWVDWFKQYRAILMSDIIHVKRADGRSLDGWLHVNSSLPTRGLAMIFNPTPNDMLTTVSLPLYYAGVTNTAAIREREGTPRAYALDPQGRAQLPLYVPSGGLTWLVVQQGDSATPVAGDPQLSAPVSADFGTLFNNQSQSLTVKVANLGQAQTLHLTAAISNSALFQVATPIATLAPQSLGSISITLAPSAVTGLTNATLVLTSDDLGQPVTTVALSATLRDPVPPVTELFLYRLGEADAGAADGSPGSAQTLPSVGALPLNKLGQTSYSTNTPGPSSSLSLQLAGAGAYTNLPGPLTTNNFFGLECWVRADAAPARFATVLNTDAGGNNSGMTIGLAPSGQWQAVRQGVAVFGGTTATWGAWTELALVVDNGVSTFYVNGVAAGSYNGTPSANARLDIGGQYQTSSHNLTNWFTGYIDEVRGFTFTNGQFSAASALHYPLPQPAPLVLRYSRQGASLTLDWDTPGPVLQESTNLNDANAWTDLPTSPSNTITFPISTPGSRYYRLRH
jgi:hypothetical protein